MALGSILGILGGSLGGDGNGLMGDIGNVLGAVGGSLGLATTGKSPVIGGTVQGRSHGMLIVRTTSGKMVYIKTAHRRRSYRRGTSGGSMMNTMLKLEMIRAMRGK